MPRFKAYSTIEIEIEIEAKSLDEATKISTEIEAVVRLEHLSTHTKLSGFKKLIPETWISSEESGLDWYVETL